MVLLVIRLIDLLVCLLTLGASIGIALTVLPLPWVVPAALLSVVGQRPQPLFDLPLLFGWLPVWLLLFGGGAMWGFML
eukprot:scaffold18866_cov48-Cyclotella_meneghiniana.AAC.10